MRFRLKALGIHLLASTVALSTILGTLYFGWYRWPGWHLADVTHVVIVMPGVDSAVGGGDDVISIPRYFKPWELGLPALRNQLKKVDAVGYFTTADKKVLR